MSLYLGRRVFDERSDYMNISRQSSTKRSNANLRSSSLPEYVNVHCAVKPNGSIRSSHSFFNVASTSAAEEPKRRKVSDYAPQTDSSRRRSDNSVGRFLNRTRNFVYNKNRSMMDFTTIRDEEQDSRYESWRRAKRFISAFSPKSQSELRNGKVYQVITKSSSTGALQYATTLLRKNTNAGETTNSMSEIYELPPALNVAVTDPLSLSALKESRSSEDTPVGLVRVKEDNQLKARGGVNIMLARRLASSVRGSFSKYDGERVTHHYPSKVGGEGTKDENAAATPTTPTKRGPLEVKILTETKPLEESEPMDAIAVSVSRKQEELRAQDRRASTVSFHKTHVFPVHPPSSTSHPEKEKSPPSMRSKAAAAARTILSHLKGAATRNSNAFSESTRSSAESLSSDARSKISIKKRSSSPPSQMAPTISRNTSRHTLVQEPSTSTDSLSSERTARSITSPQLVLPMKTSHASSSGSSTESNSASEDGSPKVRQSTSVASSLNESRNLYLSGFSPSRRFSQGQCSMTSGNTTPQTQGYFRKHRRLRRSQRTLESSSSQPNLA
ncbi:unnamed protein product [Caenorhabditis auriculariae]|uniref:Uncharacterized protein n=1 Tax=Caenorhabditis auriculariae TaxID=2777116 RepID=A0A8S1H5K3_9PELO|nr:unnamed protein product [Caenorhabditis auriculariae]